jgi:iron complex outermembrane receptor protein
VQTNIAAFYNDYKNKQESVVERNTITGATITPTVNAGSATIEGVEFETLLLPAPGLRIRGDADYLDAHYDHFVYDGVDVANMVKLLVTPKWKVSVTPEYRFAAGPGTVDASFTYSYTSSFETELGPRYDGGPGPLWNDPRGHIAPPGNLDASLSYAFLYHHNEYKITGFGHNLTDNVYIASAAPGANLFNFGTPSRPRTYGIELSAKF